MFLVGKSGTFHIFHGLSTGFTLFLLLKDIVFRMEKAHESHLQGPRPRQQHAALPPSPTRLHGDIPNWPHTVAPLGDHLRRFP